MEKSLAELRARIKEERKWVDKRPYSHNIITLTLGEIDRRYGEDKAIQAIKDFRLKEWGWNGK